MLVLIEILFLAIGLWMVVSGRIPQGVIRALFGRGDYIIPPSQARAFGLLLASPIPVAAFVSIMLATITRGEGTPAAAVFEALYVVAIAVASIVIARGIRAKTPPLVQEAIPVSPAPPPQATGYGARLAIIAGLAVLSWITVISFITLLGTLASVAMFGSRWTGNFNEDILPFILLAAISCASAVGIIWLITLLRRRRAAEH